jgi:trans-aconitate methyltransferase
VNRREHWSQVYQSKEARNVSWYQRTPSMSLELIAACGIPKEAGILDVGGGASTLVDSLLERGHAPIVVLDLSEAALNQSRSRLGARADAVAWHVADVTSFTPPHRFGLWHDRAVFHFLTEAEDRRAYVRTLRQTLQPGGGVVIATFAIDGPSRCSGLDVMRHDAGSITAELGTDFRLDEVRSELHVTPWQSEQRFTYFRLRWLPASPP